MTAEELKQMTREFAEKWGGSVAAEGYGNAKFDVSKQCLSDLNTLLKKYKDYIIEGFVMPTDMYPKEFVKWILSREIFFGELSEEYILNDNPGKFKTLEAVFDYWFKNVKK